ncbi:LuxE/PaaK family acyltransferase [Flavisolibacter nicotianae]|uniref:LuxE/PaaK family acyltransferase n=1 Tax=Flavisolibacter nicotianae TaxID=2364882 RepID=UPI001F08F572|nr:acyl transferase [Flavisolibacter nicotianae]
MMPEIPKPHNLEDEVFRITNEKQFRQIALEVFRRQYFHTAIYRSYCDALGQSPETVSAIEAIPFLPISFFKSHVVKNGDFDPVTVFQSSGTTGLTTSRHYIKDLSLYEKSFLDCFERFYGKPEKFCILGLLPSYLEQGSSSLVYMVDTLIKKSGHPQSGFYLYDHDKLQATLSQLEESGQPSILFGVTYALLDFAATHALPLKNTIVIETGGMKGRKKELTKAELYQELKTAFSLSHVHAEYGMTELLSQAYAIDGIYRSPAWMRIILRDETDPFCLGGTSGAINVIDLANLHSCSFIATEDLGKLHADGSFEVLGRMDHTDIRGCSQLAL